VCVCVCVSSTTYTHTTLENICLPKILLDSSHHNSVPYYQTFHPNQTSYTFSFSTVHMPTNIHKQYHNTTTQSIAPCSSLFITNQKKLTLYSFSHNNNERMQVPPPHPQTALLNNNLLLLFCLVSG